MSLGEVGVEVDVVVVVGLGGSTMVGVGVVFVVLVGGTTGVVGATVAVWDGASDVPPPQHAETRTTAATTANLRTNFAIHKSEPRFIENSNIFRLEKNLRQT